MKFKTIFYFQPLLLFMLILQQAYGQPVDSVAKKFPGEEAVLLNNSMQYKISIRDGSPHVESNEVQQILFLSPHAAVYMSKYGFYQSDFQQVLAYKAFTRTSDEKKLEVNDFKTNSSKSSSVFYDDVRETTFDFPSVGRGSIGNLEVSRIHKDPHLLSPFYFSSGIPVLKSELKISFPKGMWIRYQLLGVDSDQVKFSMETKRNEYIYTFQCLNCAASKSYSDEPGIAWYSPHVVFYIEKYQNENGEIISYLSGPDDLYRLNYGFVSNINHDISPELRKITDSLTSSLNSNEEKARKIYSWVQKNIKYIAFEQGMEGFIPREASLVFNRRFGDCKDMSSILTQMMRAAGIPAYYTWIGTRSLPYEFTKTPLPLVSNHMICTIRLKDDYIFLDGTDPDCIFGRPSEAIQNKQAMLALNEKEYKILRVPAPEKSTNELLDSTWVNITADGLDGHIKQIMTGYFSMDIHTRLTYVAGKDLKQYLRDDLARGSNKFHLDSFSMGGLNKPDSFTLQAKFQLPGYAKNIDGESYLNLNLFKFFEHQEIDFPKRESPIEIDFKSVRKYITLLKIPEGYRIGYLPKGKSFHNEVWGFDVNYEVKGDMLILSQEFDNDHLMIQPAQFEAWNKVLENLFPLYKETVVLTKK